MKTTNDYLDDIKALYGLPSDYAIAKKLDVMTSNIANYRAGRSRFDDFMALKVAELLGIETMEVIAAVNAERTKCPGVRDVWERVYNQAARGATLVLALFALYLAPAVDATVQAASGTPSCILCKIQRLLIQVAKRHFLDVFQLFLIFVLFSTFSVAFASGPEPAPLSENLSFSIKPSKNTMAWTRADTLREGAFMAILAADYLQTRQISDHPERWIETNPLLGEHPDQRRVATHFALAAAGHYLIARALPAHYRELWQITTTMVQVGFVANNLSLGIKVGF